MSVESVGKGEKDIKARNDRKISRGDEFEPNENSMGSTGRYGKCKCKLRSNIVSPVQPDSDRARNVSLL